MTKIKNFRIQLRPHEVGRTLKNQERLQMTPALQESIQHAINDAQRLLQPAAIYTTLARATAENATSLPVPDTAVSVSLVAVTVGTGIEGELAAALSRQDALQSALLRALREEALHQTLQFVLRLIGEQARGEECSLGPIQEATEEFLLSTLGTLLGVGRIGIVLDKAKPILPPYARLIWSEWTPAVRGRSISKPAVRSEKAAAV